MNYIFESIFVGLYSITIYYLLLFLKISIIPFLFMIGFIKHFIGYFILHSFYCKYGHACHNKYTTIKSQSLFKIGFESIIEGVLFVWMGNILRYYLGIPLSIFIIGIVLHLLAEWFGIHAQFCKRCI